MASQTEKLNTLENRVTELSGEVRFNENLLLRSEAVLQELVDLNAECKARNDVQDERMIRILEELKHNHSDVDGVKLQNTTEYTKITDLLIRLDETTAKRFDRIEERIQTLENWRWLLLGAFGLILIILENTNLTALFS